MPGVSVILPVYNAGEAIRNTFARLISVYDSDAEVIFVDDESTDHTVELIEEYCARDERATLVRAPYNLGPAGARNLGLRAASKEYVWFVDWDDEWEPQILRTFVETAEASDADFVMCRARWRTSAGLDLAVLDGRGSRLETTGAGGFDLLLAGGIRGYLWNKLLRRSLLGVDPFPSIRTQEDLCAIARLLPECTRVVLIPDVLYFHVIRDGSVTNTQNPPLENLDFALDVVTAVASRLDDSPCRGLLMSRFRVDIALSIAGTALRLSDPEVAREAVALGLRRIRTQDLWSVSRVDFRLAAKALVFKVSGRNYPRIRQGVVRVRGIMRDVKLWVQRGMRGSGR